MVKNANSTDTVVKNVNTNSFKVKVAPTAIFTPTITISNESTPIANVLDSASGKITVTVTPTTAISSVSLDNVVLSGTSKTLFGAITVSPTLPATITPATTVTFSFPYSSIAFTGTYAGPVTDSFNVSALFTNAKLTSGSSDTISTDPVVVTSLVTIIWAYNTQSEQSRLYVNGEI